MNSPLLLDNLIAYSLQIGMLVGIAAFVPTLLRLRQPGAKLLYWQILLAACLLLPLQPWQRTAATGSVEITTSAVTVVATHSQTTTRTIPRGEIILLILLAGIAVRLGWLAVGFWKLRRYRLHSSPLTPSHSWSVEASLLVCDDIASPVTFGWLRPVVLLPANFGSLKPDVREAILCHEIMHVRRRDWLFTLAEEIVRSIFWFHPAIWWLLGEIGLAREQAVDRLSIEITREREQYMDALLAIAGSHHQLDLAPAPLFLRKRHLKHRVVEILKETRMSKKRLIPTLVTGLGILAGVCWLVMGAFPLTAQPQLVYDGPGVTVNLNGATVMHRTGIEYPRGLAQAGVQGTVVVEVRTDAAGNVIDPHVLSGPDEFRKPVISSVLDWHFTKAFANTTRTVQITFEAPRQIPSVTETVIAPGNGLRGVVGGVPGGVSGGVIGGVLGGVIGSVPAGAPPPPPPPPMTPEAMQMARISSIRVLGLPQMETSELLATLPVHEGDQWTPDLSKRTIETVKAFDEHLVVSSGFMRSPDGTISHVITISTPGQRMGGTIATVPRPATAADINTIKVGGNVQSTLIITKVSPVYPPLAKSARVSGVVHLDAIIAKDGTVQELHVLGGPALLQQAALDAVKQWVYQPTLMNGQPVAVETTIDINFTLSQ